VDVADGSAADRERQAGLPKLMFLNASLARNGPLATRTYSAARLASSSRLRRSGATIIANRHTCRQSGSRHAVVSRDSILQCGEKPVVWAGRLCHRSAGSIRRALPLSWAPVAYRRSRNPFARSRSVMS
jgi:hypothetical protein